MRAYVKTFGCSSNRADTEIIIGILRDGSIEITDSLEDADAVIVNTCTVRGETESRVLKYLRSLNGKRVIVTGCMVSIQPALVALNSPAASLVSIGNARSIPEVIRGGGRSVLLLESGALPDPAPFRMGLRSIIPISRGCLGSCSYCIVRHARGYLRSSPKEKILASAEAAVRGGAREIWLTAQDTAAYGADVGSSLPELLDSLTALSGDFMIRVGMFNPSSALKCLPALVKSFSPRTVYKFIHAPMQSGSDRVLGLMRRGYSVADFFGIVSEFRSKHRRISLATDVIVGFPGEGDDDFEETCTAILKLKPDKIHIARYSPRPHTEAASMDQLRENVKKERSRRLAAIKREVQQEVNRSWVGETIEALALELSRGGKALARSREYKPVWVSGLGSGCLGKWVSVDVDACTPYSLSGRLTRR
uniref:tRNA-t(6)A37 methylthiotransferase n=1 Tax=Candidatus Methanomethylicus mesodigestus TaxID=1867258 RepID=A0A7C3ETN0_9CREN